MIFGFENNENDPKTLIKVSEDSAGMDPNETCPHPKLLTFNGNNYLRTKGCAMGTVAAPSYAVIYMGEFEEKYIYPIIGKNCLYYGRYIDDIVLIYKGSEQEFETFAEKLNTKHPSIKFDYEVSKTPISFLDTRIYIDENRQLQTTLFTKPTYAHNYLHYKSAHPRHLKNSLPTLKH